jgi:hypothetical protein
MGKNVVSTEKVLRIGVLTKKIRLNFGETHFWFPFWVFLRVKGKPNRGFDRKSTPNGGFDKKIRLNFGETTFYP